MKDFTTRIKQLENEILALKMAAQKSAATLATVSGLNYENMSNTVSMPLRILSQASETVRASQAIKITVTPDSGGEIFATCTPRITSLDGRQIYTSRRKGIGSAIVFVIDIWGSDNDFNTLNNGGSVTLTLTFDITASGYCTTAVSYEDYDDE